MDSTIPQSLTAAKTAAVDAFTTSPLLTDLYQLNMIQAYLDHGDAGTAVFELFVRSLPPRRGFLLAAGLHQALDFFDQHTRQEFDPASRDAGSIVKLFMIVCPSR